MHTMGHRVVDLEPIHGFAAETTGASVIYGAALLRHARLDDPRDLERDHGRRVEPGHRAASAGASPGSILIAWVLTIPAAVLVGAAAWYLLNALGIHDPRRGPATSTAAARRHADEFRLIPKDEKFHDLFIADGQNLAAARKLEEMVGSYDRLERARVRDPGAGEAKATRSTTRSRRSSTDAFITPFDREDIHDLVSRLDDVLDGIQAIAETFVIYDVKQPTDDARRLAGILAAQAAAARRGPREARGAQGHRAPRRARSTSSRTRRTACPAPPSPGCSRTDRPDRGHQVARRLHGDREHDRRRRGRRRGHRADRRQERLSARRGRRAA